MDDPDVVLLVHPYPDRHAEQPVERLRPERIDLEHRRLHIRALRLGLVLQHGLADAEADDRRDQHGAGHQFALCHDVDHDGLPNRFGEGCFRPLVAAIIGKAGRACNGRPSARNVTRSRGAFLAWLAIDRRSAVRRPGDRRGARMLDRAERARPRDPGRRQDQRLRAAGRRPAGAPDPRAARRHARGRVSDPRAGLSRPAARRRGAAQCNEALADRRHRPLRERRPPRVPADRQGAGLARLRPVVHLLRAGARACRGAAARRQSRALLEPAVPRRAARLSDPLGPLGIRHPSARRPAGPQGLDRAALPAAGRRRARVRVPRRPGAGAPRSPLAPGRAAVRGRRLLAHSLRHRPPAVPGLPGDPVPAAAAARHHRHGVHGRALDLAHCRRLRLRAGRALVSAADRDA